MVFWTWNLAGKWMLLPRYLGDVRLAHRCN